MRRAVIALVLFSSLVGCRGNDAPPRDGDSTKPERRRFAPANRLGRIDTPEITEASGIASSMRADDVFWVHNDSGDAPRLFCVDDSGGSCGTVNISGAEAHDWEDIATARGSIYIGDIGDNAETRENVVVYVVPEGDPPGRGADATWSAAERLEFTYPTGPVDAEALLVHPRTRHVYVITKDSPAIVLRGNPTGGRMRVVGALRLPGLLSFPTAGDIATDGLHAVIGTYDDAFELTLERGANFDRIWRGQPRAISLPLAVQREATAYARGGSAMVSTSEGRRPELLQRALSHD